MVQVQVPQLGQTKLEVTIENWLVAEGDHIEKGEPLYELSNEKLSQEIEGDRRVYLHTQSWSHVAIQLYKKFGFYITREPDLYKYKNDEYEAAEALLEKLYPNK